MASYIFTGLLFALVARNLQVTANPLGSGEEECLEPIENIYYASDDDEEPCHRLGAAMVGLRNALIPMLLSREVSPGVNSYESIRRDYMEQPGIDIDKDQDIMNFACELAAIGTTDELAELVNGDKDYVADGYRSSLLLLAHVDGFHGVRMGLEVWLATTYALRDLSGQEEGIIDVGKIKQVMTPDALAQIFSNLEDLFGSGYLVYGMFRPYNDALVGVDPHVLANAIFDWNLACTLGLSNQIEDELFSTAQRIVNNQFTREIVDTLLELYIAADQTGLFHLR